MSGAHNELHMLAVLHCASRFPMVATALNACPSYNIKSIVWFRAAFTGMMLLQKWCRGG